MNKRPEPRVSADADDASDLASVIAVGDSSDAISRYRSQLESIESQRDQLKSQDRVFAKIRVGLFLLAVAGWIVGVEVPYVGWGGWIALGLFLVVATLNEPIRDRLAELRRHRNVVRRLIWRLERDWQRLSSKALLRQLSDIELAGHRREVASDLDLLGPASLFNLVSMAATQPGIRTLARWLSGPAEAELAKQRAAAVDALAPLREQRLRFYTLARQVGESSGDPDHFVQWATSEPWLKNRRWMIHWSVVSSAVAVVALIAMVVTASGLFPSRQWFIASLVTLAILTAINLLITTLMLGPAHAIFSIAMSNRRAVSNYEEIFSSGNWLPEPEESEDGFLGRIRRTLTGGPKSALTGMRELRKVARAGGLRQSAGTFLIYLPLQCLTLWDVRVLQWLEQWQMEYQADVADWFEALGELESLVSVAALRDDYPDWATPSWCNTDEQAVVAAESIGHPLLHDQSRVCNDVQVGPPGTLLLVTGSNMSGKSTLLRSIGLNVSLAAIGGPVCASSFRLPSVELATSIRVSDDVSQGVSFYMAELKRLKSVVDHAREMARLQDRVCLFLLDEILQGTNSRERQIAVVQVLRHLVSSHAIGAISTHDLELADEPELLSIASTVHFRETIVLDPHGQDQMTFDYKMRQGVSPTTNALRLLKMVGLGDTEEMAASTINETKTNQGDQNEPDR